MKPNRPTPGPDRLVDYGRYSLGELLALEFSFLLTLAVIVWAIVTR